MLWVQPFLSKVILKTVLHVSPEYLLCVKDVQFGPELPLLLHLCFTSFFFSYLSYQWIAVINV